MMGLLFIDGTVTGKIIQAFCWMLIHSLWQGLLFTIVTGCLLIITKKSSASLRYNIISILFILFLSLCGFTFIKQWNAGPALITDAGTGQGSLLVTILHIYGLQDFPATFTNYFSSQASLIVMIWLMIFCFKCIRMTGALIYNERIRNYRAYSPARFWIERVEKLSQQLQLKRKVMLLESEIARIPVVIGHLKPVILIPLGLLANLPPAQVEAVLLHELAHIRRSDYFVNLLQNIAETIFFFNPGLLWMSALLKDERENCCDDIAISQTKNKKEFIQALVSFKEHAASPFAPAFPGKRNQLLLRVTRIIQNRNKALNFSEKIFLTGSLIILFVIAAAVGHPETNQMTALYLKTDQQKSPVINQDNTIAGSQSVKPVDEGKMVPGPSTQEIKKNQKPIVIEYFNKTITTDGKEEANEDNQNNEKDESMRLEDADQAATDREMAEQDRAQALDDLQQTELDRMQGMKDREEAEIDRQMAEKDKQEADGRSRRSITIQHEILKKDQQ